MKKRLVIALFALVLIVGLLTLASCDGFFDRGSGFSGATITVTFDTQGGSEIAPITIGDGSSLTLPPAPTRDGYVFSGWYLDEACVTVFDDTISISKNITLYAKWVEDDGEAGSGTIIPSDPSSGTITPDDNPSSGTIIPDTPCIHIPDHSASCTEDSVCTLCGELLEEKLGHNPNHDANCIEDSVCTRCELVLEEALGHNPNHDATCTEDSVCTRCEIVLEEALGHNPNHDATCTEDSICIRCELVLEEALGHNPNHDATCTEDSICIRCELVLEEALGHNPNHDANCTEDSVCTRCEIVLEEALGHTPNHDANCTEDSVCTRCELVLEEALGHNPNHDANCTEDSVCTRCELVLEKAHHNYADGICTICGDVESLEHDILIIEKQDSDYVVTGVKSTDFSEVVVPNYITKINKGVFKNCSNLTSITIPFVGASKDGTSNTHFGYIFGASLYYDNDDYVPSSLKTVIITGGTSIGSDVFYYCSGLTSVTIPDSVTSIGWNAFSGCSGLTSVTIPDGVTSIGWNAFSGCSGLTSITIPDSVTRIGEYAFYDCSGLTSITVSEDNPNYSSQDGILYNKEKTEYILIPDNIQGDVTIPNGITSIGIESFYNCSGLTSITIPDSVTSIGYGAFSGCDGLTAVYITDLAKWCSIDFTSFYGSNPLYYAHNLYLDGELIIDLVIPDSVTSIGDYAFSDCSGLTSVTIPDSVTSIGSDAFYCCSGLTSVTIPDSVTNICDSAFWGCRGLTSVTIGNSVTSIGSSAFSGCYKLVEVYNLSSLDITAGDDYNNGAIGRYALDVYTSLDTPSKLSTTSDGYIIRTDGDEITLLGYVGNETELTIPDNVTSIYQDAFYNNTKITSIVIPDSVTSIGSNAFYNTAWCNNQPDGVIYAGKVAYGYKGKMPENTSITIKDGTLSISDYAFAESELTNVTIPDSVTSIGEGAFAGCYYLTSVTIGKGVTSIGYGVFEECFSLISITIPDSVTSIGDCAFEDCHGLTSVTIGNGVTSIGWGAFGACFGLTSVTIGKSVTSIGSYAFDECVKLVEVYNLSSLNITAGSSKNGYVGYYALNVYTSLDTPSKLSTTSDGYIIRTNGEKISLLGYVGNETELTIPNNVTSIYKYAFYDNYKITSVIIPDSVTSIGYDAFGGCYKIETVIIDSSTIAGLSSSSSCLLDRAETVYVKEGLTVGSYITDSFTLADISDKDGYVMYVK